MPLPVVELRDLREFTQGFADTIISRDAPVGFNDVSTGWDLGVGDGFVRGGGHIYGVYDHIRDRYYTHTMIVKNVGGIPELRVSVNCRDALHRNTTVGWYRDIASVYTGTMQRLKVGTPNLVTGQQKVYCYNSAGGLEHHELDPLTGTPVDNDIWPNLADDFLTSPIASGTAGYWLGSSGGVPLQAPYMPLIFEGITDTTGWEPDTAGSTTEGILRGGTTHTKGLALMSVEAMNVAGGTNLGRRWCWIDLDSGEAVGVLGIPTVANSTNTTFFAEPTIDGVQVDWRHLQFVPDTDSTIAQPKGELHVTTGMEGITKAGQTVAAPTGSFTSSCQRHYVTVYDFNPFKKTTGVVRVHNRRTFLGIIDIPHSPIQDGGPNLSGTDDAENNYTTNLFYHPPSRTYCNVVGRPLTVNSNDSDAPTTLYSRIIRFRRQTVVEYLSSPTPETAITENRTVKYRILAYTDLGSEAVGVSLTASLYKLSTRSETFDGTVQAGTDYVVDQGVIDDDGSLAVYSGGTVDTGGTLLVEGVDYNVSSYTTGTLAPVGSWPADTISVRYRHRSVPVAGGHGTLLNATVVTDENGQAFARVRYGDNVDGEIEKMEVTT